MVQRYWRKIAYNAREKGARGSPVLVDKITV